MEIYGTNDTGTHRLVEILQSHIAVKGILPAGQIRQFLDNSLLLKLTLR